MRVLHKFIFHSVIAVLWVETTRVRGGDHAETLDGGVTGPATVLVPMLEDGTIIAGQERPDTMTPVGITTPVGGTSGTRTVTTIATRAAGTTTRTWTAGTTLVTRIGTTIACIGGILVGVAGLLPGPRTRTGMTAAGSAEAPSCPTGEHLPETTTPSSAAPPKPSSTAPPTMAGGPSPTFRSHRALPLRTTPPAGGPPKSSVPVPRSPPAELPTIPAPHRANAGPNCASDEDDRGLLAFLAPAEQSGPGPGGIGPGPVGIGRRKRDESV